MKVASLSLLSLLSLLFSSLLIILCVVLCFASQPAVAQVNVERSRPQSEEGFKANLDGGLNLIRGNVNLTQVNLMTRVQYTHGAHSPFLQAMVAYGEKEESTFLNQAFVHARWTAMWWRFIGSEVFAQLQENAFRSLILRQLYGGGVRIDLHQSKALSVFLGTGYMFERELSVEEEREVRDLNHRSTNYLMVQYHTQSSSKKSTSVVLSNIVYFQPRLDELSDLRLLNDLSVEVKLSERLRLIETLSLLYDSRPPQGVQRTDLKSLSGLRVVF